MLTDTCKSKSVGSSSRNKCSLANSCHLPCFCPKWLLPLDFGTPILADCAVVEKEPADGPIAVLVLLRVPKVFLNLRNTRRFQRSY